MRVTEVRGVEGLPGWRFRVGSDGSLLVVPAPGERITADTWRRIPVGRILAAAADEPDLSGILAALGPVDIGARRGHDDERLRHVAATYRAAITERVTPRRLVAARFGVSDYTAGVWITAARKRGLLDAAKDERRKAREGSRP